jgi:multisubunit Na+/H+ antiporter MnhG subunit
MSEVIVDLLLFAGVLELLMCAAGTLVMGNAFDRLHYASASAYGALLVAVAILARESLSLIGDKALATAALLVLCGPTLAHATARAGRIRTKGAWDADSGVEERERTRRGAG